MGYYCPYQGKDDRELVNAFRGKQVDTTPARINVQEEWYQKERAEEEQKKKDFEENQKRSEKAKKEGETEPGESHMVCLIDHHSNGMFPLLLVNTNDHEDLQTFTPLCGEHGRVNGSK